LEESIPNSKRFAQIHFGIDMKRLLVIGASGFLGWNICRFANPNWTMYGTYYSHPIDIPDVKVIKSDVGVYKGLKKLFKQVNPTAVIHTAVVPDPNFCQENKSLSYKINTEAAINIAGLCGDLDIPCLFTSTDLVFDGLNPPYTEQDEPSPLNVYGEHKALAEIGMKRRCPSLVICRMPLMFGDPGPVASGIMLPLVRNMKLGIEVNLFVDEFRTPLSGRNATEGLMIALEKLPDIIHLGGAERVSRYEFGKLVVSVFNIPNAKLNPCRQQDVKMAAARPPDVCLDSTKAQNLGFQPNKIKESLQELLGLFHN